MPGGIAENARFVVGQGVTEVGLCFFETAACLAYGKDDLPGDLADLPLSWHVHLPVDLPWRTGAKAAASAALRLMDKVEFLDARQAVLHLPEGLARPGASAAAARMWGEFAARWQDSGRFAQEILLENQPGDDPQALLDLAAAQEAGLCFDFSHWLMTCGAKVLPSLDFLRHCALLHLNAPGPKYSGHAALTELTPAEQVWATEVLRGLPTCYSGDAARPPHPPPRLMLEMFSWEKIAPSLPLLQTWLSRELKA